MKEMPNSICGNTAVGGNYNSTCDSQDAGYTANLLDDSGAAIAPDDAAEEETEGKDTKKRGSKEKDESESDDEERYIVRIIVI